MNLLKEKDRTILAAYCETWATFVDATRTVQRESLTIRAKQGTLAHPAVVITRKAGWELRAFASYFALALGTENAVAKGGDDDGPDTPFAVDQSEPAGPAGSAAQVI